MKIFPLLIFVTMSGCASTGEGVLANAASAQESAQHAEAMNHYLASIIYENTGQYAKALEELRKAADLAPEETEIQLKLLAAYYLNQDYENAEVMAKRALEAEPNNVVLHVWLGRIYYQQDKVNEAVTAFEKAIQLAPESAVGYEALAEVEEDTNDLVGAVEVYERLIELRPDSAFLRYRLGLNLARVNDYDGAQKALEKALDLDSELDPAMFLLGVVYLERDSLREAIKQFDNFLAINEGHLQSRVNKAGAHARLGEFDEALSIYSNLIEGGDAQAEHHIGWMYLLLRKGEIDDPSVAVAPSGAPLTGTLLQILIRKQAGEPHEKLIESLGDTDSDLDFETSRFLNSLLSTFGNEDAGEFLAGELKALRDEGVKSRVVDIFLGRIYMLTDRYEESAGVFEKTLDDYGSEKWLRYYLASVHEELDNPAKTERHLTACLEHDPDDPDVMNFLGYFYAEENKKLDRAKELLEKALQADPENGFYLDSLGWIYYRMGDAEKAIDYISRAIRNMSSDDAVLRDHLGDAYLLNRQYKEAIAEWRRARRLDPDLAGVTEKIEKYLKRIGE